METSGYDNLFNGPDSTSHRSNEQSVYYRNSTHTQLQRYYNESGWSGEVGLGGYLTSASSATSSTQNRIDLFTRGGNGRLYNKWWTGTWYPSGTSWQDLGSPSGGITSGPDASSWYGSNGNQHINAFARGADNAIWMKTFNSVSAPTGWSSWESIGGVATSDPTAVSRTPGVIDVFVRGGNNEMYHNHFESGTGWEGWVTKGGFLEGAPDVTANPSSDRLWIAVQGGNDVIYRKTWSPTDNPSWSDYESLESPPGGAGSDPTALYRDGLYIVWVRGGGTSPSPSGRLWQKFWSPSGGWTAWTEITSGSQLF